MTGAEIPAGQRVPELELQRLSVRYGSVHALSRVSATVGQVALARWYSASAEEGRGEPIIGSLGGGESPFPGAGEKVLKGFSKHEDSMFLVSGPGSAPGNLFPGPQKTE